MDTEIIEIHYHSDRIEKLTYIDGKSDWIDLRAAEDVTLKKGEFAMIDFGISLRLPDGYEAIVAPRSSTFKNFGILQVNSIGVIDESYGKNSTDDVWKYPVFAVRDTEIHINDRIAQFRIQKHQPRIVFREVGEKKGETRGGFGSSGVQ
ncbi:MAG: deoxyuridine 5'-triphosphate nucleotidohydrolase [Lachnospiraceae bacterium]|nr:deoxyuridine 5'-triphosphate nucleotidohydrolase [Lachnospiraceae bacterium]